ncbi:MAG: diacylglycerol kinase family lipid kinase [Flavobacteriaceae bacterium]|jgi:YegS/Rv2252/BmrU family lipid kinase|nr:diacylglycerol kinase family lipid kinase [Flavobacteriaceae bacterium]
MIFNNIHFIINPISGKGKGSEAKKIIEEKFPAENRQIKLTRKKNDAYSLAWASAEQGADLIVSCGGDGTLNEIASALAGKNVPLAIVPIGSGNGLARHLKIPLDIESALQLIVNQNFVIKNIDCGKVNSDYFFSNMGIGFDAEVINEYAHQKQRKLVGYLKSGLLSVFKFRPVDILLNSDNESFTGKVMLLNIANSNEMGYGISLTPEASLEDGLLNINLVRKCSWLSFAWMGLGILFRKNWSKNRKIFLAKSLKIETSADYIQLDGEFHPLETKKLEIYVVPKALKILC